MRKQVKSFIYLLALVFLGLSVQQRSIAQEEFGDISPLLVTHSVEVKTISPMRPFWIVTQISLGASEYSYWRIATDTDRATSIDWKLPNGFKLGEVLFAQPTRDPNGDLIYDADFFILSEIIPPRAEFGLKQSFDVSVSWALCTGNVACEKRHHNSSIQLDWGLGDVDATVAETFMIARASIPRPSPWFVETNVDQNYGRLSVFADAETLNNLASAAFYPISADAAVDGAATVVWSASQIGIAFPRQEQAPYLERLEGLLLLIGQNQVSRFILISDNNIAPRTFNFPPPTNENIQLTALVALFFAFAGGMILNLMPCVFPILAMKAFAFAEQGEKSEGRGLQDALYYTAGIVASFIIVGGVFIVLRSIGQEIGWGFQLQSPSFVFVLILIMSAVVFNFLGVFNINTGFEGVGNELARKKGGAGSFATGVLATLVATPCTAPFMAPAIAYALTTDIALSLGIFIALGLGMAFPYILISHSTFIRSKIPAPGPWMIRFKRYLAIPVGLTVVWLLWVLSLQIDVIDFYFVIIALVGLFAGLFLWGQLKRVLLGQFLILVVLLTLVRLDSGPKAEDAQTFQNVAGVETVAFSRANIMRLRSEKRPIFVNVTAAWCITCLVHERLIFSTQGFQDYLRENEVVYMVADWTNPNPEIAALLEQHGRSGIPFYLYYPSGGVRPPILLPELLTGQIIRDTIGGNL